MYNIVGHIVSTKVGKKQSILVYVDWVRTEKGPKKKSLIYLGGMY